MSILLTNVCEIPDYANMLYFTEKRFFFCMFCIQPSIIPAALENFLDLDLGN